jgi:hypothetical protein
MRRPQNWADELLEEYTTVTNTIVRSELSSVVICMHLCQGNSGVGLREAAASRLWSTSSRKMQIDGCFLEYDTQRAGHFAPLRFVPNVREQFSGRQGAHELSSAVQCPQAARARRLGIGESRSVRRHGLTV